MSLNAYAGLSEYRLPDGSDSGKGDDPKPESRLLDEGRALAYGALRAAGDALGAAQELLKRLEPRPVPMSERPQWTVALNLTTDFGKGYGVPKRLEELREFAEKTKGSPVTFVVQAAIPDAKEPKDPSKPTTHHLDRYLIKDGKIEKLHTVPSQGYDKDVQALLRYTTRFHPSQKLGLLIDSHGLGNEGLQGDTGKATVDQFKTAVREGLKGSGHAKLEFLDFDCCLMGQNGVLNKMRDVTRNLVASAETEHVQGQFISGPFERLAKDPSRSGQDLGKDFVDTTKINQQLVETIFRFFGAEPKAELVPISTLAQYNLEAYPKFKTSLDALGEKLAKNIEDPKNYAAVEKIIDDLPTFGGKSLLFLIFNVRPSGEKRDLQQFLDGLDKAIKNKDITDNDGSLKKAIADVRAKQKTLIDAYYGHEDYAKYGGLTTFLPGRSLRNIDDKAYKQTSLYSFLELTKPGTEPGGFATRFLYDIRLVAAAAGLRSEAKGNAGAEKQCQDVMDAIEGLKDKTGDDYAEALQKVHSAAKKLEQTEWFKQVVAAKKKELGAASEETYRIQLVSKTDGWGKFRERLRSR